MLLSLITADDSSRSDDQATVTLADDRGQFDGINALCGTMKEDIADLTASLEKREALCADLDQQVKTMSVKFKKQQARLERAEDACRTRTETLKEAQKTVRDQDAEMQAMAAEIASLKLQSKDASRTDLDEQVGSRSRCVSGNSDGKNVWRVRRSLMSRWCVAVPYLVRYSSGGNVCTCARRTSMTRCVAVPCGVLHSVLTCGS